MENASKALIIAGAILLAIVIISLGLVVVNNVRDKIGNSNMDAQEIEAFNNKFTSYAGDKISGTKVNALMNVVSSSNADSFKTDTDAGLTTDTTAEEPYISVKHLKKDGSEVTNDKVDAKYSTVKAATKYPTFGTSKSYKVEVTMTKGIVSLITVTNLAD